MCAIQQTDQWEQLGFTNRPLRKYTGRAELQSICRPRRTSIKAHKIHSQLANRIHSYMVERTNCHLTAEVPYKSHAESTAIYRTDEENKGESAGSLRV